MSDAPEDAKISTVSIVRPSPQENVQNTKASEQSTKSSNSPLSILYRGSLLSCNYDCGYCPFAKAQDSRESLAKDAIELTRFVDWVSQQTRPIRILFTPWGEAFIRRYYQDAIIRLGQMPHVKRIAIQTNLSLSTSALKRCQSEALALWCTYHPSQISREAFLEKCRWMLAEGMRFSVGMVGNRNELDEIGAMREALPPEIYLWANANRDEQPDYQQTELELLKRLDPLFEHNLHQYPSEGKSCNTGSQVISVDSSGNVQRCHFVKQSLGNLYDGSFRETHAPCPNYSCDCHIGYIHLPNLKLESVYDDGLLERIPQPVYWQ